MNPIVPTGDLVRTADGVDLVLVRELAGDVEDVWASVTEPDRTERWIGRWEGDPAPGAVVRLRMGFEEDTPWSDVRIDVCEPPHRLAVTTLDEGYSWSLEVSLRVVEGGTELRFVHHAPDPGMVGDVGAGWEYYLDQLAASRRGTPLPDFTAYPPAVGDFYADRAGRV